MVDNECSHLRLECGAWVNLPGRLEHAKHALFALNAGIKDWTYTAENWNQLRLVPNTTPNGYLWRLLIVGNPDEKEQLWCRAFVTNERGHCDGMLARPGSVALQQWYAGRFPHTHTPVNMRFIGATPTPPIGAAPTEQQPPDLAEVLNEMRLMREENQAMFRAMSQRSIFSSTYNRG